MVTQTGLFSKGSSLSEVLPRDAIRPKTLVKCLCGTEIDQDLVPEDLKFRPQFCSVRCARSSGMNLNYKNVPHFVYIKGYGEFISNK